MTGWVQEEEEEEELVERFKEDEDILLSPPGCVFWNSVMSYISELIMSQREVGVLCVETSAWVYVGDILRMSIEVWGFWRRERGGMAGWYALLQVMRHTSAAEAIMWYHSRGKGGEGVQSCRLFAFYCSHDR
jgi:hypothetical protein